MRNGWFILAAMAGGLLAFIALTRPQAPQVKVLTTDLESPPVRPMVLSTTRPMWIPVSVVALDRRHYLLADYQNVLLLDRASGHLTALDVLAASGSARYTGRWNPTGLALSPDRSRLFIANYTGNNILIARLTADRQHLVVEETVSSPDSISPENVALSADGRVLVCANYDGHSFLAFAHVAGRWVQRWKVAADSAHGVAIIGRYAFGANLGDEQRIYKIDLETGRVVLRQGVPGWDPGKGQFLYPTALAPLSPETLLVADARTGHLTVIEAEGLKPRAYLGDNGPGYAHFNMPYGIAVNREEIIVLSSFQRRILFLDRAYRVRDQLAVDPHWPRGDPHLRATRLGHLWSGYINEGPTVTLWGAEYKFGVTQLHPRFPQSGPRLIFLDGWDLLGFGRMYMMFLDAAPLVHGTLLVSPQTDKALYVRPIAPTVYCVAVPVPLDTWVVAGELRSPAGKLRGDEVVAGAEALVAELEQARAADGRLRLGVLRERWARFEPERNDFQERLEAHFRSEPGRAWLQAYLACEASPCDQHEVQALATTYLHAVREAEVVALDEYCLVQTLSGTAFGGVPSQ